LKEEKEKMESTQLSFPPVVTRYSQLLFLNLVINTNWLNLKNLRNKIMLCLFRERLLLGFTASNTYIHNTYVNSALVYVLRERGDGKQTVSDREGEGSSQFIRFYWLIFNTISFLLFYFSSLFILSLCSLLLF
jgi:hypothetical protein